MTATDELLAALDAELGLPPDRRPSGGDDETLQALRHRVRAGGRLLAAQRPEEVGRLAAEARGLALASLRPGALADQVVGWSDAVLREGPAARTAGAAPDVGPASGAPAVSPAPTEAEKAAFRRRVLRWLLLAGGLLLVASPILIWASLAFDMPALRMVSSWSIAAVVAAAIVGLMGWLRDRRG